MPFKGPFLVNRITSHRPYWLKLVALAALLSCPVIAAGQGCGGCCDNETECFNGTGASCDTATCTCVGGSPIIIDTTGQGFHLTSTEGGVTFDLEGNGIARQIAWTAAGSGDAFLALDRNGNGKIDNGKELFGNFTRQPKSDHRNGYLALAEFDKPENGGNGDGIIDSRDRVFSRLLLWIDENHDGISQPNELYSLPELGVYSVGLRYRNDRSRYDQFGNWFHYQGLLNPDREDGQSKDGRMTYDVFFVSGYNPRILGNAKPHSLLLQDLLSADFGIFGRRLRGCGQR